MESEAARKNIRISVKVEPDIYVEADEDRLRQIIMNLLSNGINYTPEGGQVSIHAEPVTVRGSGERMDYDHIRIHISERVSAFRRRICRAFSSVFTVWTRRDHGVQAERGSVCQSSSIWWSCIKDRFLWIARSVYGSTFTIELPVIQ